MIDNMDIIIIVNHVHIREVDQGVIHEVFMIQSADHQHHVEEIKMLSIIAIRKRED
eukprot:CAMPEP_0201589322 /NCGR_PEP_ID=MMETSP0190_2-20130828/165209_1 /ASSEMBLY_ACC=CAM_ASM_000263 /TAXON_ID=37353 /ORGANISM="Rosalina sp." /LENGTH=55 /DNA_ID=CAMNT_0048043217 /DNA_START=20 /DNA_END=187 /DNA_ORIENTATION=+